MTADGTYVAYIGTFCRFIKWQFCVTGTGDL